MDELPNIYRIDAGGVSAYLIFEFDGLTLIDTGFVDTPAKVIAQVETLGRSMSDLKRIILTHRHPDHVSGAGAIKKLSNAEVWAPQPDAHAISDDPKQAFPKAPVGTLMRLFAGSRMTPAPCAVDQTLTDGALLPVLGGLRVIATPGHTVGHCSLYHEEQRVLFAGDAVMTMGGRTRATFPFLSDDYEESCRSIRDRLAPLGVDHILAGHGAPVHKNAGEQLEYLAMKFKNM